MNKKAFYDNIEQKRRAATPVHETPAVEQPEDKQKESDLSIEDRADYLNIPVSRIEIQGQVRTFFPEETLLDLTRSILEHRLLQPVLVREDPVKSSRWDKYYVLVVGERRLRSFCNLLDTEFRKRLEKIICEGEASIDGNDPERLTRFRKRLESFDNYYNGKIPAVVLEAVQPNVTDERLQAKLTSDFLSGLTFKQLIENIQREDLHPLDLSTAINQLQSANMHLKDIARELGKDRTWLGEIANITRKIPGDYFTLIRDNPKVFTVTFLIELAKRTPGEIVTILNSREQQEAFKEAIKKRTVAVNPEAGKKKTSVDPLDALFRRFSAWSTNQPPLNESQRNVLIDLRAAIDLLLQRVEDHGGSIRQKDNKK
jgi:hypothetical protein